MKRMLILPLCLLLLCGGCGKKSGAAADIQAQYGRIHTAQMEAEVTFHTPQENRSFTLQCAFTPESSTVTVTAPETVAGVSATVSGDELTIAYDGAVLSAGSVGRFGPVNALPLLLRAIGSGYLLEESRETLEDTDCCRLTLDTTAGDTPLTCTAWLDAETLLPRYAEFAADDAVVVSAKLLAFSCALQEPEP